MMAAQLHALTVAEPIRRISITYQPSRKNSQQIVVTDAPITPPLSPKSLPGRQDSMAVDNPPSCTAAHHGAVDGQPESMDFEKTPNAESEEMSQPESLDEPAKSPARLLEDEQVRLQPVGLKLSDFEVRGTLGKPFIKLNNRAFPLIEHPYRHRHFWKGFTSPASWREQSAWHTKPFRNESAAKDGDCSAAPGGARQCRALRPLPCPSPIYCRSLRHFPG